MLNVNNKISVPLREFEFTFSRSSGPGGQNVNKLNTKALLRWRVTTTPSLPIGVRTRFLEKYRRRITGDGDILITSQRFRDQGRNVADCLAKLRHLILTVESPPKTRRATKPSRGSKIRRRKAKEINSKNKQMRKPPSRDS